ncbi:MAG: NERD domain-containing protein [Caldiserica bacterium]|jgi:uncharacterized membrane protein YuzA (DUF378 family)|nr:NERD domain-containing protein [Caldisericota bacterium]
MNILGDIVRNTSWGWWLTLFLLFGAVGLLWFLVPLKEFPGKQSSGGGTSSYTSRRALQLGKVFFFTLSALCFLGLIGSVSGLWKYQALANAFGFFSAAFIILGIAPLYRLLNNFLKGSEGEGKVEVELRKLSQGFFVFHDLPTGRGNIDHVVIGPTGIFTVETKNWKGRPVIKGGTLYLGKYPCPQLSRQALSCALFLSRYLKGRGLSAYVTPVLCLVQKEARSFRGRVGNVEAVGLPGLIELLSLKNFSLTPAQVEKIKEALMDLRKRADELK